MDITAPNTAFRHRIAPPSLQRHLAKAGGKNPYGEPLFRLVWGASRIVWRHGEWEDKTEFGIRRVVEARQVFKYARQLERWHIEKWHPPEYYGDREAWPTEWKGGQVCETLGEFPSRGGYESVDCLERLVRCTAHGKPVCRDCGTGRESVAFEPTYGYLDTFLWVHQLALDMSRAQKRTYLQKLRDDERKESIERNYEEANDATRAFYGQEFASLAGLEAPGPTITGPDEPTITGSKEIVQ